MAFPMRFIAAMEEFSTFEKHVPAPYMRKSFTLEKEVEKASLVICGLGFYELFVNGARVTKGALAPYISNPDDVLYYDAYDVKGFLHKGENAIGAMLGNGMQNAPGGATWDFDKARWRGAPKLALRLDLVLSGGEEASIQSDESFLTSPSPILFDDLRCGERYDARLEQPGWNNADFDAAGWKPALPAPLPKGEPVLCEAEPIVVTGEYGPFSIEKQDGGFLYDFGLNRAGVCRLSITGESGQEVTLTHGEYLQNGRLDVKNIQFMPDGYVQTDVFICKGGRETYTPSFTYHGFQYVFVTGITGEQATQDMLTCLVMNSDIRERGGFACSHPTANALQEMTRRSTLANFYYFPTDCPHREKNGWTGDAALSAEHMLLNLTPDKSYREWLRNIRKAMNEEGALPGIVPTGGWGFAWGNGPAWDCVLAYLPYFTYIYRGDEQILRENAAALFRYLHYLSGHVSRDGLIRLGLGDWCPPGRGADKYKAPLEFTDTVVSMDICKKAAYIFRVLGMTLQQTFAESLHLQLLDAVRERLIDFGSMTAAGCCQTSQAMAIFYDVFTNGEKPAAFERLMSFIRQAGGHMDTGILGARVLFHVLSAFGQSDLAFEMITRPDYPSYGNWVARGATSLWEDFQPEGVRAASRNHHFFGDISGWFIKCVAGIRLNPHLSSVNEADVSPAFINALDRASGFHLSPAGKIEVQWRREGDGIALTISVPEAITGKILLPEGYAFEDGVHRKALASGAFTIIKSFGRL